MALSTLGSIVCIGNSSSVKRFSEIQPEVFFSHRTYSWSTTISSNRDGTSKCVAEYEFRLLLPFKLVALYSTFADCKWKIKVSLEGRLEDWFDIAEFIDIPAISAHPLVAGVCGRESVKGVLIFKNNELSEELLIGEKLGMRISTTHAIQHVNPSQLLLIDDSSA